MRMTDAELVAAYTGDGAGLSGLRAVEFAAYDRAIATVTRTIQGGTDPMLNAGAYIIKALQDMKEE